MGLLNVFRRDDERRRELRRLVELARAEELRIAREEAAKELEKEMASAYPDFSPARPSSAGVGGPQILSRIRLDDLMRAIFDR